MFLLLVLLSKSVAVDLTLLSMMMLLLLLLLLLRHNAFALIYSGIQRCVNHASPPTPTPQQVHPAHQASMGCA
jgi:hypothetical protein